MRAQRRNPVRCEGLAYQLLLRAAKMRWRQVNSAGRAFHDGRAVCRMFFSAPRRQSTLASPLAALFVEVGKGDEAGINLNIIPTQHLDRREKQDFQIKPEAIALGVPGITLQTVVPPQVISTIDL